MGLYKNIIHWDYDFTIDEKIAWIRHPFREHKLDPIFKIIELYDDYTADLEVLKSDFLTAGVLYYKQPLNGYRRVKLTTISDDLEYKKDE